MLLRFARILADAAAPPDVLPDNDIFGEPLILIACVTLALSLAAAVAIIVITVLHDKKK